MLYCMCIIVRRNYSLLRISVINCEIRVVIYTFFRVLGNEKCRKKSLADSTLSIWKVATNLWTIRDLIERVNEDTA